MNDLNFINSNEEKVFYKKYLDICQRMYYGEIYKSRFLTPNEVNLLISLMNRFNFYYHIYESSKMGERKILIFSNIEGNLESELPDYISIIYFKIKNHGLSHRDILGSLMSLGIERDLIGDILIGDDLVEICLLREIADYVSFNIKKIKKLNVKFQIKDSIYLEESLLKFKDENKILSSLRLDAFVAAICGLSRDKAKKMISSGLVKLDYTICQNPSEEVKINSSISVRGYGRFYYIKYLGSTKKDKYRVEIRKLL